MKNIVLVCAAGMSTSLLVTKMRRAAETKGIAAEIYAISAQEVAITLKNKPVDVLLLAPQVKFYKKQFELLLSDKPIPMEDINVQSYGMMNGEMVLEQALALIETK